MELAQVEVGADNARPTFDVLPWDDEKLYPIALESMKVSIPFFNTLKELGFNKSQVDYRRQSVNENPHVLLLNDFDNFGRIEVAIVYLNDTALLFSEIAYLQSFNETVSSKWVQNHTNTKAIALNQAIETLTQLVTKAKKILKQNNIPEDRTYDYIVLTEGVLKRYGRLFDKEAKTIVNNDGLYPLDSLSSEAAIEWLQTGYSLRTIFLAQIFSYSFAEAEILENTPDEWLAALINEETLYNVNVIKESIKKNITEAATVLRRAALANPKINAEGMQKAISKSKIQMYGATRISVTIHEPGTQLKPPVFSITATNKDISKSYEYSFNSATRKYYEIA